MKLVLVDLNTAKERVIEKVRKRAATAKKMEDFAHLKRLPITIRTEVRAYFGEAPLKKDPPRFYMSLWKTDTMGKWYCEKQLLPIFHQVDVRRVYPQAVFTNQGGLR